MEAVGTGFRAQVDYASREFPPVGAKIAGLHFKLLN